LGAGAVLSLGEAVALLPVGDRDARDWLEKRGLVRSLAGRPVVIVADIHAELRAGERPQQQAPATAPAKLPRVRLDSA